MAIDLGFIDRSGNLLPGLLGGYEIPGIGDPRVSTILSGLLGVAVVLGAILGTSLLGLINPYLLKLLIDDVMGELDARRRAGLMPLLERAQHASGQVFMTCTEESWPRDLGKELIRWEIRAGSMVRAGGGSAPV